jgi:hypothetical protein
MRAENRLQYPDDLADGMLIKMAAWGSFLVWQPIEKLCWDVTNRPWRCLHLLWRGPDFGQNKHEISPSQHIGSDCVFRHMFRGRTESGGGHISYDSSVAKSVCEDLRDWSHDCAGGEPTANWGLEHLTKQPHCSVGEIL